MIEIVCPSCEARYQLPDGSIGSDGRNVSCSSCSHKWRAFPEGAGAAAPPAEAPPVQAPPAEAPPVQAPPAQAAPAQPSYRPNPEHAAEYAAATAASGATTAPASPEEDARTIAEAMEAVNADTGQASAAPAPAPAAGDREEQMDAIRKMLSDLKEGADAAAAAEPEPIKKPEASTTAAASVMRRRDSDDDDESDTLKSRIDDLTKMGKAAKGEASRTGFDTQKLRKQHERRAKRMQKARERRGKSGAFMTGFTFVSLIAVTMVGLYVMKPQIVAASPGMAPVMDEYVVTVDRYRVELNEKTVEWRAWLQEKIEKLKGEEEAAAQ